MGLFKKITSLFGTNEHKPNPKKRIETPEFIYSHNLPEQLGIMSSVHSLNRLAARLEDALNDTYMNQVRDRVMSKHRYTAEKYNWMLLELKRYFILCSVLKHVPMYSNDTDVIWHEMLMFTQTMRTSVGNSPVISSIISRIVYSQAKPSVSVRDLGTISYTVVSL
ncbi:hypothetical protein PUW25_14640 [Paenibacillus urinalis]|uniref:Uncharacterized protein n=1 Tax=Paenibacillus urinalis TaxID=521520 RepID=A0ABY7XA37_9BACL|nr:hypothetical protein [Paenibacillus urinalis]WDI00525.1 hypothetical protein PUW25_14640 [Paenibacillus urinalis]